MKAIVVGTGFAGMGIWLPILKNTDQFNVIGTVDPLEHRQEEAKALIPDIWTVSSVQEIPGGVPLDTVIWIITPDHFSVIADLAALGFKNLVVEKPLVSRDEEVEFVQEVIANNNLRVYAIDHYYQKFLGLEFVLGRLDIHDPRVESIRVSGDHSLENLPGCLGDVEGITYTNIEAGDLGIPYLDAHTWLEKDPHIGGIIRDLGPHAFAPLVRSGFLGRLPEVYAVELLQLNYYDRGEFVAARSKNDIEMYVHTVLVYDYVTSNITFCKAPFPGKERSLSVRASNGTFHAGLARGQSGVVMANDGTTTRISLCRSENELVVQEASLFFEDKLPGFDGNLQPAITALQIGQRIRNSYFSVLR